MLGVRKKLREARFFLGKMGERAELAFGGREDYDFYLSAFLSAGRSVDYRLRHEQGAAYVDFRANWDAALPPDDRRLIGFMVEERNFEIHESGSTRAEHESRIPIDGSYQDKSWTVTVFGPPGAPLAEIIKPTYSFTIDKQQIPVIEGCRRYLDSLERLVAKYCQSQGIA